MQEKIPFPLTDMFPDIPLPGSVFLYLSNHYIHYKTVEDVIEGDRFKTFQMKNVKFIFINEDDYDLFDNWCKKIKRQDEKSTMEHFLEQGAGEHAQAQIDLKDSMSTYFAFDLDDAQLDHLEQQTREIVTAAKDNFKLEHALASMENHHCTLIDHSMNVANLAVFLALNIGYNQVTMLETVYLGGLLHDYGKTKISNKVLDMPPTSSEYIEAMEKHPTLGAASFMLNSDFSNEVQRIIIEHHEKFDGSGFPNRLRAKKIYPLSTIVSIANYFDTLLANDSGHIKEKRKRAIRRVELEANRSFDPRLAAKAVKNLKNIFLS